MFASIPVFGALCVWVCVCVPGHVAVGLVRRHSVSIANGDRKGCIAWNHLKLPQSQGELSRSTNCTAPDSNNNNLLKHLSASTLCGILLTGPSPICLFYHGRQQRKANKPKLAIDVRLTRRMSDANATFMACACLVVVLSLSLLLLLCVMCRRKCLHLDMKELRGVSCACVCVCVCVSACLC